MALFVQWFAISYAQCTLTRNKCVKCGSLRQIGELLNKSYVLRKIINSMRAFEIEANCVSDDYSEYAPNTIVL